MKFIHMFRIQAIIDQLMQKRNTAAIQQHIKVIQQIITIITTIYLTIFCIDTLYPHIVFINFDDTANKYYLVTEQHISYVIIFIFYIIIFTLSILITAIILINKRYYTKIQCINVFIILCGICQGICPVVSCCCGFLIPQHTAISLITIFIMIFQSVCINLLMKVQICYLYSQTYQTTITQNIITIAAIFLISLFRRLGLIQYYIIIGIFLELYTIFFQHQFFIMQNTYIYTQFVNFCGCLLIYQSIISCIQSQNHQITASIYYTNIVLVIFLWTAFYVLQKRLKKQNQIIRNRLAQCHSCEEIENIQCKNINNYILFDFLFAINIFQQDSQELLYERIVLYIQFLKKQLLQNNCDQCQILCNIIMMLQYFHQKFNEQRIQCQVEQLCQLIVQQIKNQSNTIFNQFQGNTSQFFNDINVKQNIPVFNLLYQLAIDLKTLKFSLLFQNLVFSNTGVLLINKSQQEQDKQFVCDLLSREREQQQLGSEKIMPLSQFETNTINQILNQFIQNANKYIDILKQIKQFNFNQYQNKQNQILLFNSLVELKFKLNILIQQLIRCSPYSFACSWAMSYLYYTVYQEDQVNLEFLVTDMIQLDDSLLNHDYSTNILEKLKNIQIFGNQILTKNNNQFYVTQPKTMEPQVTFIESTLEYQKDSVAANANYQLLKINLINYKRKQIYSKTKKQFIPKSNISSSKYMVILTCSLLQFLLYIILFRQLKCLKYSYKRHNNQFDIQGFLYQSINNDNIKQKMIELKNICQIHNNYSINITSSLFQYEYSLLTHYKDKFSFVRHFCSLPQQFENLNKTSEQQLTDLTKQIQIIKPKFIQNYKYYNDGYINNEYSMSENNLNNVIFVVSLIVGTLYVYLVQYVFYLFHQFQVVKKQIDYVSYLQFVQHNFQQQNQEKKPEVKQLQDENAIDDINQLIKTDSIKYTSMKVRQCQYIIWTLVVTLWFLVIMIHICNIQTTDLKSSFKPKNDLKNLQRFIYLAQQQNIRIFTGTTDQLSELKYSVIDSNIAEQLQKMDMLNFLNFYVCTNEQLSNDYVFCGDKLVNGYYEYYVGNLTMHENLQFFNQPQNNDIVNLLNKIDINIKIVHGQQQWTFIAICSICIIILVLNLVIPSKNILKKYNSFIIVVMVLLVIVLSIITVELGKFTFDQLPVLENINNIVYASNMFNPKSNDFINSAKNYKLEQNNHKVFCIGYLNYINQFTPDSVIKIQQVFNKLYQIDDICRNVSLSETKQIYNEQIQKFDSVFDNIINQYAQQVQQKYQLNKNLNIIIMAVIIATQLLNLIFSNLIIMNDNNLIIIQKQIPQQKHSKCKQFINSLKVNINFFQDTKQYNSFVKNKLNKYFIIFGIGIFLQLFVLIITMSFLVKSFSIKKEFDIQYKDYKQLEVIVANINQSLYIENQIYKYNISFAATDLHIVYNKLTDAINTSNNTYQIQIENEIIQMYNQLKETRINYLTNYVHYLGIMIFYNIVSHVVQLVLSVYNYSVNFLKYSLFMVEIIQSIFRLLNSRLDIISMKRIDKFFLLSWNE